ncbi:MAG: hypothetical protein AAB654_09645 [Acidobacteriota bacterium]
MAFYLKGSVREEVEEGVARIRAEIPEWASQAVLYDLPDNFRERVEPQLRVLAGRLFAGGGPALSPALLRSWEQELRQRLQGRENAAGRQQSDPAPGTGGPGPLSVVAVVSLFVAAGLCLDGFVIELGWRGWAVLACAAAALLAYLGLLPGLCRDAQVFTGRLWNGTRRGLARWGLGCRLAWLGRRGRAADARQARVDEWIANYLAELSAEYEHYKQLARAARVRCAGASRAGRKETPLEVVPDPSAFQRGEDLRGWFA